MHQIRQNLPEGAHRHDTALFIGHVSVNAHNQDPRVSSAWWDFLEVYFRAMMRFKLYLGIVLGILEIALLLHR